MSQAAPAPVRVDDVTKRYGRVAAVAGLSFALEAGTITGFLGPNGAGKTTTLRMIGGLLHPTGGEVLVHGIDARQPAARARLGYMPADPVFLPQLSGRDNLELLARLHGGRADDRTRALAALGLGDDELERRVRGYSSGMRQKLAIVAAVRHAPDLVVLDEPANRLDPIAHHAFCELLRTIAAEGRTVLLSSHVLAEVEAVCSAVLLVREGRLLTAGRVEDLRERATRVVTLTYARPPAAPPAALTDVRVDGVNVSGRVPADRADVVRDLLRDPDVVDITIAPPSLEDIVLRLYTGGQA